jgi:TonB family protein
MRRIIAALFLLIITTVIAQAQTPRASQPIIPENEQTGMNEPSARIFRAGNEALVARQYDEAIKLYDEGIALAPKQAAFWANKAAAHLGRGTAAYNAALLTPEEILKRTRMEDARKDFREATNGVNKARELINALTAPSEPVALRNFEFQKLMILRLRASALWLMVTKVDASYAAEGLAAFHDYTDAETDSLRKGQSQLLAAQMLLEVSKYDLAVEEYQKILASDLDNVEANLGAGVSLIDLGYAINDQAKLQEGLRYLEHFVEKAPETHRLKGSAEEVLSYLKRPPQPVDNSTAVGPALLKEQATVGSTKEPANKTIEGGVINGKALSLPAPPYPLIAKMGHAQGTIAVQVLIDEEGNVIAARAVSGHPLLEAVAVAAARRAKFSPTTLSGKPVKVSGVITYNFVAQ